MDFCAEVSPCVIAGIWLNSKGNFQTGCLNRRATRWNWAPGWSKLSTDVGKKDGLVQKVPREMWEVEFKGIQM